MIGKRVFIDLAAAPFDVLGVDRVNGPYHEIYEAVAAAQDGNTILVAPGWYNRFTVDGRALTIVGTAPGLGVAGIVRVQALAAH